MLRVVAFVFDFLPSLCAFKSHLNVGGGQPKSYDASDRTPSSFSAFVEDIERKITKPIVFYLKRIKVSLNAFNLVCFHG